jgi:hypothetical protein
MLKLALIIIFFLTTINANAYIGPGMAGGVIAAIIGIVIAILAAIFVIIWFPIKRLILKIKQKKSQDKNNK